MMNSNNTNNDSRNNINNINIDQNNRHMNINNLTNMNNINNMNLMDSSESYSQPQASPKIGEIQRIPMQGMSGGLTILPEDIQPKLQNIVSTANLKCELDLREIALRAKNAE
jgi:hypothetical protein